LLVFVHGYVAHQVPFTINQLLLGRRNDYLLPETGLQKQEAGDQQPEPVARSQTLAARSKQPVAKGCSI
jgi:hypothetical protein